MVKVDLSSPPLTPIQRSIIEQNYSTSEFTADIKPILGRDVAKSRLKDVEREGCTPTESDTVMPIPMQIDENVESDTVAKDPPLSLKDVQNFGSVMHWSRQISERQAIDRNE